MNEDERGSVPADARFKPSKRRFVLACVAAPLLTPPVLVGAALVVDQSLLISDTDLVGQLVFTYLVGLPLAYLAEVLLGLPAWQLFQFYRIRSAIAFALCGGVIGLAPPAILGFEWRGLLSCASAGAASALLFWTIVFWRVPDSPGD